MNTLNHVAIIMDGNGRWGLKKKNSRNYGHLQGIKTVETIIKHSIINNIPYLTLYTFSTENWSRPKTEINFLFSSLLLGFFKYSFFILCKLTIISFKKLSEYEKISLLSITLFLSEKITCL